MNDEDHPVRRFRDTRFCFRDTDTMTIVMALNIMLTTKKMLQMTGKQMLYIQLIVNIMIQMMTVIMAMVMAVPSNWSAARHTWLAPSFVVHSQWKCALRAFPSSIPLATHSLRDKCFAQYRSSN